MDPWDLMDAMLIESEEWCVQSRMYRTGNSEATCRRIITEILQRTYTTQTEYRLRRNAWQLQYQTDVKYNGRKTISKQAYEARGRKPTVPRRPS
jgi:hypothetical protein